MHNDIFSKMVMISLGGGRGEGDNSEWGARERLLVGWLVRVDSGKVIYMKREKGLVGVGLLFSGKRENNSRTSVRRV